VADAVSSYVSGPYAVRLFGREHLAAGIAARPLQFIHSGRQRRLSHDPHEGLGFLLCIDLAARAIGQRSPYARFRCFPPTFSALRYADAPLRPWPADASSVEPCSGAGLASSPNTQLVYSVFGCGRKSFHQSVQGGPQLLAVRFIQRAFFGFINDAIQLLHVHIDAAARGLLHNRLSKSRKCGVSG
jgi:hypothetical protein